jgi:Carboxypeptidase regulatory-like domain
MDNISFDQLAILSWRYRSSDYQIDGSSMWTADLGYAVGSRGNGPYVALSTAIIPGLNVQARYQAVSLSSNTGEYSVAIVTSFGTQAGLYAGNRRIDEMRTQGGILVQPFYDRNSNGKRDNGESIYSESSDFLILNNELVNAQRVEKHSDRFLVRLLPGMYRLDLEAAGFPPDFQPTETSMAVRVTEGSYTPIMIALQPSYTASGIIRRDGQPLNGARVEATHTESKQIQLATTNTAGVYYLEPLRRGTYRVTVNGKPANPEMIQVTESSKSLEEINFTTP